jgi:isopenicillin N synthase-like dioxygenase
MSFTSIPNLDLALALSPTTKPALLAQLRHALLEVGFLYISNTGIPTPLTSRVKSQCISFFDLPLSEKLKCEMVNQKSFLGYNRVGAEITALKVDHREQLDLSTPHPVPAPEEPLYRNLLAPNQWPEESALPGFRETFEEYIRLMGEMSMRFTSLCAQAIGLPGNAFAGFFDEDQQHKLKVVKYPDLAELGIEGEAQGVGPHKDSMLTSYLLQASPHRGLQVQNAVGEWVDVPPVEGTFVVAIGQGMEALTRGVCQSTTHRVLSPARGDGARYSIPFFQGVSYDAKFEAMDVPESVRGLKSRILEERGIRKDDVEFTFVKGRWERLGEATFMNRVKSHPDVSERWYPEQLAMVRRQQAEDKRRKEQQVEDERKLMDMVDISSKPAQLPESTARVSHGIEAH